MTIKKVVVRWRDGYTEEFPSKEKAAEALLEDLANGSSCDIEDAWAEDEDGEEYELTLKWGLELVEAKPC